MSTRGLWGWSVGGEEKLTYNHSDSYPSWLGKHLVDWLREQDLDEMRKRAEGLRVVDEDSTPSDEDKARLAEFSDLGVGEQTDDDWYCLLRDTQGDPDATLAAGVMTDGAGFAADSLFCEWAYVIDLDTEKFEVYRGFQNAPHDEGRFAGLKPQASVTGGTYYPVKLVAAYALRELPPTDEIVAALEADEEAATV